MQFKWKRQIQPVPEEFFFYKSNCMKKKNYIKVGVTYLKKYKGMF
jgi:hypothetical protein